MSSAALDPAPATPRPDPSARRLQEMDLPPVRRVLQVMRMTGASGAENHLIELSAALRDQGWRVDALIPSPAPPKLERFVERLSATCERVDVLPMRRDFSPRLVRRLARSLSSGRYAIAHAHLVHADWHLAAASLFYPGIPLVSSKHNPDPFRRLLAFRRLEQATLSRYAAVIAISDSLRQFTEESTGVRAVTVRYGLTPYEESPPERTRQDGPTHLLAVGRLEEQKGFDIALEAMAIVRREVPRARLFLAGEGRQGVRLRDLTLRLGLEESVSFLGQRDDVGELMREADLLVHPARWEGFGLVLLEAMRAGLPIVAARVAAIPEIVADGRTGILVSENDPPELAAALLALIRDPGRRRAMGRAGYERLREHFSPDEMARRTAAVYKSVVADRAVEQAR